MISCYIINVQLQTSCILPLGWMNIIVFDIKLNVLLELLYPYLLWIRMVGGQGGGELMGSWAVFDLEIRNQNPYFLSPQPNPFPFQHSFKFKNCIKLGMSVANCTPSPPHPTPALSNTPKWSIKTMYIVYIHTL